MSGAVPLWWAQPSNSDEQPSADGVEDVPLTVTEGTEDGLERGGTRRLQEDRVRPLDASLCDHP